MLQTYLCASRKPQNKHILFSLLTPCLENTQIKASFFCCEASLRAKHSYHHVCSLLTLIHGVFFQYSEHPDSIQAVSAILAGVWNLWLWDLTAGGPPVCVIINSLYNRFWTDLAPIPPLGMSLIQGGFVLWKRWKENIGGNLIWQLLHIVFFLSSQCNPSDPSCPRVGSWPQDDWQTLQDPIRI